MLTNRTLLFLKESKTSLLLLSWLLVSNAMVFSNTIVDAAGVYSSVDIDRIELKIAEVEAFHNIEIDVVTCTSALPQVGFVVSSTGLTGRKLLINIPAGIDIAGMQASSALAALFPVSSLERISEHVLRPLVGSRDYCLATLETLDALLTVNFQIKSLSFVESIRIKNIPPDSPEWVYEEGAELSKPVAYAYTDKVKIIPKVEAIGRPNGMIINLVAKRLDEIIRHQGIVENGFIVFQELDIFEFNVPLNHVGYVESFTVDWYLEVPSSSLNNKLLTSSNELFITFGKPSDEFYDVKEVILKFTCEQGFEAVTQEDFISKIWAPFTTRRLRLSMFKDVQEDGILTYYNSPTVEVDDLAMISNNTLDGQCGAFDALWANMLFSNGIFLGRNAIQPSSGINPDGTGEFILVKNWEFSNSPSFPNNHYTHVNQVKGLKPQTHIIGADIRIPRDEGSSIYEFLGTPQMIKLGGVSGQGVDTPYADFGNHYNTFLNGAVYDASYGLKYLDKKSFEEEAIDAFYVVQAVADEDGNEKYFMYVRKNRNDVDDLDYN